MNESLQIKMENIDFNENEVNLYIFEKDYINVFDMYKFYKKNGVVCFTGNRPSSLPWKYNENCEVCREFRIRLKVLIKRLIDCGYYKFITGMAMGFDIIAAEIVLELKQEGENVELECALPCLNQTNSWESEYIKRYQSVLDCADKVTFTSKYNYFAGCYTVRNQYMVDNADLVLGCQLKKSLGTKATINYAKSKSKTVLTIM